MYIDYELNWMLAEQSKTKDEVNNAAVEERAIWRQQHELQEAREKRKRLEKSLSKSQSSRVRAQIQSLLDELPSIEMLNERILAANDRWMAQRKVCRQATDRHRSVTDSVTALKTVYETVCRKYGHVINMIQAQFGKDTPLSCRLKGQRLDIYFGGKDYPIGDGHAHWVFNHLTLEYRRDPGGK